MKHVFYLALTAVVLSSFVGCKKEQRPEGLPDLYPCSVKILQDGAPLEGANVTLVSDDATLMRWPCGGNTNAEGVAEFNTYGFPGAPAGKFHVMIAKSETVGGAQSSEEAVQNMKEGIVENSQTFDLIDPVYKSVKTTPLTLDVQSGENPITEFDVGAATHESIKMK